MFNLSCEISDIKKYYPNERQYAKAITFGIMYQAGPAKIAETVNKDAAAGEEITKAQSSQFINKYFREAKSLKRFIDINLLGVIDLIDWVQDNGYADDILTFTVVHDSIVSEVREDLIDIYVENAKRCIQKDRGLSIPNCPIKVDFEVGDSWGNLSDYK